MLKLFIARALLESRGFPCHDREFSSGTQDVLVTMPNGKRYWSLTPTNLVLKASDWNHRLLAEAGLFAKLGINPFAGESNEQCYIG